MKLIEPLDRSPEESPDPPDPQSETTSSAGPFSKRPLAIGLAATGFIFFIILVILANNGTAEKTHSRQPSATRPIQVDVLNGTGEAKLALRFTDFLRGKGFDVVDMANYKSQSVEKTIVIDRVGNLQYARAVAEALGLPEGRVVQHIDKNLYLEVSVVIGKDYQSLKAFQ